MTPTPRLHATRRSPRAIHALQALAAVLVTGCAGEPAAAPGGAEARPAPAKRREPDRARPAPARFQNPAIGRFHMRLHFDELGRVEQLLLSNRIEDAQKLAPSFVARVDDPGLERWQGLARRVADAAVDLAFAPGLDEALRRQARLAAACASCHVEAQSKPVFPAASTPPPDGATPEARMARHVWATEQLREGVIGPAADRWKRGLEILAATPPPFPPLSEASPLAARLQQLARSQLAPTGPEDRATAYGELLVVCAACHTSLAVPPR